MQIFIHFLNIKIISINIELTDYISEIKTKIKEKEKIYNDNEYSIYFYNEKINESKQIKDYPINENDTLYMISNNEFDLFYS
jgi:hypothetical protein